jgi:hypothetical protein
MISQISVFVAFFLVPLLNVFRIDVGGQHFFLFGKKFAYDDGLLLLVAILFLVLLVVLGAKISHRFFCSYMCPHNTFVGFLIRIGKRVPGLDWAVAVLLAPLAAFALLAYFVDPGWLWNAIISFRGSPLLIFYWFTAVGLFLLFGIFRYKFCANACPYGFFQMVFKDTPRERNGVQGLASRLPLLILVFLGGVMVYMAASHPGYHARIIHIVETKTSEQYIFAGKIEIENLQFQPQAYSIRIDKEPGLQVKMREQVTLAPEEIRQFPITITGRRTTNRPILIRVTNPAGTILVQRVSG